MSTLQDPPPQLKAVQSYMHTASFLEEKYPEIAYWLRLFSVQTALKIDRKSPECVNFLTSVMDWMETFKKSHLGNEVIINETVGQAYVENFVMDMFNKVDNMDRNGTITKNTAKLFYTCCSLFESMEVFGPLTDDISQKAKYARFKAGYILRCLRTGETPQPGPIEGSESNDPDSGSSQANQTHVKFPDPTQNTNVDTAEDLDQPPASEPFTMKPPLLPSPKSKPEVNNTSTPNISNQPISAPSNKPTPEQNHQATLSTFSTMLDSKLVATNGQPLKPEEIIKSQKYCKFAGSALQYDDVKTAVANLEKALRILNTGSE